MGTCRFVGSCLEARGELFRRNAAVQGYTVRKLSLRIHGLAAAPTKRNAVALVIPDKLYFRIGEVSRLLDLPAYVLRFWETEFPQLKPGKGGTGQRLYRRRDVETLAEIRRLLYDEGYTIPGARQALKADLKKAVQPASAGVPADAHADKRDDSTALRLRKLRSDLLEVASLLERPLAHSSRTLKTQHRGMAVTPRRRPVLEMPPPLFAVRQDDPAD